MKDLQTNFAGLEKSLNNVQANQTVLAQKVDDLEKNIQETLANHLNEAKKGHESFMDEARGLLAKIPGFGDSKKSKGGKDE